MFKKPSQNRLFAKKYENGAQNGLRFGPRILPQFPPEGSLFRLGPQGRPKGAQGCQKGAKRPQNGPKRSQKGTKKVPKGSQRGMKIIFKIKITKIIIKKKNQNCLDCLVFFVGRFLANVSLPKGTVAGLPQASGYIYIYI